MKIYVASSWRNKFYPEVVKTLRDNGFDVYDFRNPEPLSPLIPNLPQQAGPSPVEKEPHSGNGFKWQYVSSDYMQWSPEEYRKNLSHPLAEAQFRNDIEAMESCDACVMVLPCGRSAHTEAGWFAGKGKKVICYMPVYEEADLMYKLFDGVACTMDEVVEMLKMITNYKLQITRI